VGDPLEEVPEDVPDEVPEEVPDEDVDEEVPLLEPVLPVSWAPPASEPSDEDDELHATASRPARPTAGTTI
jgi:hypothetical protein